MRVSGEQAGFESSLEASRVYFDLREDRGVILEGVLRTNMMIQDWSHPLVIRAAEIRQVCSDYMASERAQCTTCIHAHPHYHLNADRLNLRGQPEGGVLEAEDASLDYYGVPVPLPDMSATLGEDWPIPLRRLQFGRSSKYGTYMESLWGKDMNPTGSAVHEFLGIDNKFRGKWLVDLDVYGKRGIGFGPGIQYRSPGLYKGYVRSYYIRDKAGHDHEGPPIQHEDRGWAQTRNRVQLPDFWLLDLEVSYISDPYFLTEYFEEIEKEDKEPETLAYLHRGHDSNFYSFLAKTRLNDFQETIERLPEARWTMTQVPLLGRNDYSIKNNDFLFHDIYYRHQSSAAQLRYRQSSESRQPAALPTDTLFRADYLGGLEAPVSVGPFKVVPYVEQRITYYEETISDTNGEFRYIAGAGATASILISQVSETHNDFLNIHGLRHIFEPTVSYRNNFEADPESQNVYQYDEVDAATDSEVVLMGLRHRMQTRNEEGLPKTFFEGFYSVPAFPNKRLNPTGERFGNFRFDMTWQPDLPPAFLKNITFREKGEYDFYESDLQRLKSLLALRPYPEFELRFWHSWIRDTYEFFTYSMIYELTPRYEMDLQLRRNLRTNTWMQEALIVRRRAHQWVFELEFSVDRSNDDRSVAISVMPLSLFSQGRESSFYDPRRGD
jgi:hypothetical protein